MEAKDVKVGMKVVPTTRSINSTWEEWAHGTVQPIKFFNENGYLFVDVDCGGGEFRLNNVLGERWGDKFNASDFEPAEICVGDTVRATKGWVGAEGIVTEVDDQVVCFKSGNSAYSCDAKHVDLVRKAKKPAEPEKPWRPKIGDKVVFIDENANDSNIWPPVGTIGVFTRDDGSQNPEFTWPELGKRFCTIGKLRPATPDEIAAFKKPAYRRPTVGDWVEIVDRSDRNFGKVGVIDHITESLPYPVFVKLASSSVVPQGYDDIKLTTPPEQKPEPREFKVGDRVRDDARGYGAGVVVVNQTCKILTTIVKWDSGHRDNYTPDGRWRSGHPVTLHHIDEPVTVLRSEAEAAVRRAYCEGFGDGQKHIVGCVVKPKPTKTALAKFLEAD
jgi:hypothetical protein